MIEDLSVYHHPVGSLFRLPGTREEWQQYRLSDEQIAFFHENGYLPGIRILTDEQVEQLREELDTLMDSSHPGHHLFYEYHSNESKDPNTILFHALGAWRITPGFHDILWHPAFTVPAAQLLGGAVRFWHDQLFCKPPKQGGVVAWHQDYSYWTRTQPQAHLTCWIGLDDATQENGALMYIPGSHRWQHPGREAYRPVDTTTHVFSTELQNVDESQAVDIELAIGECSFHDAWTVHASAPNYSSKRRCGYTMRYMPAHVVHNDTSGRHRIYLLRGKDRTGGRNIYTPVPEF